MSNIQDYEIDHAERTGYGYGEKRSQACDCDECGCKLYDGDTVIQIKGFNFCEDCIEEATTSL